MTFWLNWEIYLTVLLCSNKQLIRPASARGMYMHKCFVYSFVCVCVKRVAFIALVMKTPN